MGVRLKRHAKQQSDGRNNVLVEDHDRRMIEVVSDRRVKESNVPEDYRS